MTAGPATVENRTFDEIAIGDSASVTKRLTRDDIALFAAVSGDVNPIHPAERLAEASPLRRVVGHSLWDGGLMSGLLGRRGCLRRAGDRWRQADLRRHPLRRRRPSCPRLTQPWGRCQIVGLGSGRAPRACRPALDR